MSVVFPVRANNCFRHTEQSMKRQRVRSDHQSHQGVPRSNPILILMTSQQAKRTRMLNELTIEITQQCPNECLHCSSKSSWGSMNAIEPDQIIAFAKEAKSLGLCEIALSGGEPVAHPYFSRIVSDLQSIGLYVVLYTTGIRQIDSKRDSIVWDSESVSPNKVIYSIFSHKPYIHNEITQMIDSHQLTLASLRSTIKSNIPCEVHIVPMATNIVEIETTINWLLDLGVMKISLLRLVRQGRARDNWNKILPAADDWALFCHWALKAHSRWGARVRLGVPLAKIAGQYMTCHAGREKMLVRSDGAIFPCEAFKDSKINNFQIGELSSSSFDQILATFKKKLQNEYFNIDTNQEFCPAQMHYLKEI